MCIVVEKITFKLVRTAFRLSKKCIFSTTRITIRNTPATIFWSRIILGLELKLECFLYLKQFFKMFAAVNVKSWKMCCFFWVCLGSTPTCRESEMVKEKGEMVTFLRRPSCFTLWELYGEGAVGPELQEKMIKSALRGHQRSWWKWKKGW